MNYKTFKKQEKNFYNSIKGISNRKANARLYYGNFEKTFYNINVTTGFIAGFVIDTILPCTLGLPMRILSKYGRVLYNSELRHSYVYKVLNVKYLGSYLRGFLK